MRAPAEPNLAAEKHQPAVDTPGAALAVPLNIWEMSLQAQKAREAVLAGAQLDPLQVQVLDQQVERMNARVEELLAEYETSMTGLSSDREEPMSREFVAGVLSYVSQTQSKLAGELGPRFAAAAETVDFDLGSQIDGQLIERLASLARPQS